MVSLACGMSEAAGRAEVLTIDGASQHGCVLTCELLVESGRCRKTSFFKNAAAGVLHASGWSLRLSIFANGNQGKSSFGHTPSPSSLLSLILGETRKGIK